MYSVSLCSRLVHALQIFAIIRPAPHSLLKSKRRSLSQPSPLNSVAATPITYTRLLTVPIPLQTSIILPYEYPSSCISIASEIGRSGNPHTLFAISNRPCLRRHCKTSSIIHNNTEPLASYARIIRIRLVSYSCVAGRPALDWGPGRLG